MGETTVSSFAASCHVGTHVDAPCHLDAGAGGVESIPLERLIGPAEVIAVAAPVVAPEHLPSGWNPATPRLLLRTDSHRLDAPIGPGFAALDARLVHWLADRGVLLVGIDTPSVDPFDSDELPAHRALAARGMTWIEGLWLGGVTPGRCHLAALPMAVLGADGAPARVVVRPHAPGEPAA
jgi:arylformamidase